MTTESSNSKKRKPLGLKKSLAAAKKTKKEEEEIQIEIGNENLNDFEELKMIYESAQNSYLKSLVSSEEEEEEEEESAKSLFRGVVHECDKMIRIRQENPKDSIPNATDEEIKMLLDRIKDNLVLPPQFHLIYANALFYLSILEEGVDATAFLEESLYRVKVALEIDPTSSLAHASLARSLLQKALITGNHTEIITEIETEVSSVLKALEPKETDQTNLNAALELANLYSSLTDLHSVIQDKIEWTDKASKYWTILQSNTENCSKAFIGQASYWLNMADYSMEYLEENPDTKAVTSDKIQEFLLKAIATLEKVTDQSLEDKVDESFVHSRILLGECHVHVGNLLDTDPVDEEVEEEMESNEASIAHYKLAVDCFQHVQTVQPDALPAEFADFLNDWKIDLE